jgi:hypothetical protein
MPLKWKKVVAPARPILAGLLLLGSVSGSRVSGQPDTSDLTYVNRQFWIDFNPSWSVTEKFQLFGDLGYRTFIGDIPFSRFYIRPSLKYRLNRISEISGGIGAFFDTHKKDLSFLEIRPWQGLMVYWPGWGNLGINHCIRLEERFRYLTTNQSSGFSLRGRYQLSARYDFLKKESGQFWFLSAHGEIFVPLGKELEELFRYNSRISLGIGHHLASDWQFHLLYTAQTSRSGPGDILKVSDHILRIRISKRWRNR